MIFSQEYKLKKETSLNWFKDIIFFGIISFCILTIWSDTASAYISETFEDYSTGTINLQKNWYTTEPDAHKVIISDEIGKNSNKSLKYINTATTSNNLTIDLASSTSIRVDFNLYLKTIGANSSAYWSIGDNKGYNFNTMLSIDDLYSSQNGLMCENIFTATGTWYNITMYYTVTDTQRFMAVWCNYEIFNTATGTATTGMYIDKFWTSRGTNDNEIFIDNLHINKNYSNSSTTEYCISPFNCNSPTICPYVGGQWFDLGIQTFSDGSTSTVGFCGNTQTGTSTFQMINGGIIIASGTQNCNNASDTFRCIFGNKDPFWWFYTLGDIFSYWVLEDDGEGLDPISLTMPTIYGTGTHATTVIMSEFEIPIIEQEWFFRILPENVWHQLRALFSAILTIAFIFGMFKTIKQFLEIDT